MNLTEVGENFGQMQSCCLLLPFTIYNSLFTLRRYLLLTIYDLPSRLIARRITLSKTNDKESMQVCCWQL
jgi:hypothetical protein